MNAETLNFRVVTTGRPDVDERKPSNLRPMTLDRLLAWINAQPVDEPIKAELFRSAKNYPQQALGSWQKNYQKHLSKAQKRVKSNPQPTPAPVRELGEDNDKKESRELPTMPTNDFDAGWESISQDIAAIAGIHPDVQEQGSSGSGLESEYSPGREGGEDIEIDAGAHPAS